MRRKIVGLSSFATFGKPARCGPTGIRRPTDHLATASLFFTTSTGLYFYFGDKRRSIESIWKRRKGLSTLCHRTTRKPTSEGTFEALTVR